MSKEHVRVPKGTPACHYYIVVNRQWYGLPAKIIATQWLDWALLICTEDGPFVVENDSGELHKLGAGTNE